jgi:hypothetical protein
MKNDPETIPWNNSEFLATIQTRQEFHIAMARRIASNFEWHEF